jgi:hypothetical protein
LGLVVAACGGPARHPVVDVTTRVPTATQPRCDGRFEGSVTTRATWPAGRGSRLHAKTTLTNRSTGVVITRLTPDEMTLSTTAAMTSQLQGNLENVCNAGAITTVASSEILSASPPSTTEASDAAPVPVRAVGFLMPPPLDTRQPAQAAIGTTFTLACCPGSLAKFTVDWPGSVNVKTLGPAPNVPALNCAANDPPKTIALDGTKDDPQAAATIVLRISDGANACTLPIPFE